MRKILVAIIISFIISCNVKPEAKTSSNSIKKTVESNCEKLFSFTNGFDFLNITKKEFQLDLNKDFLNKNFKLIDKEFHDKYLNDKRVFREWDNDLSDYIESEHKILGLINNNETCKLLIFEKFTLDETVNKMFLLLIDHNGVITEKYKICENFNYAGGRLKIYSEFSDDKMSIISINERIINQKDTKYEYQYDSITTKYKFKENKYLLESSDTIRKVYWE